MQALSEEYNCSGIISLQAPIGSEKRRGFQPPWYTVYKYKCPECGTIHYVRAGAFRGIRPEPGVGGIVCGAKVPAVY